MSQVETPVLPPGRSAGADAAKNPKARLTAGGREERGQAFRSLLQTLEKGAGKAVAEKPAEPGRAEPGDKAEAFPAERLAEMLATAPMEPTIPTDGTVDAARLLLGAVQPPAPETRPEPRREAGPRRDGFAALSGVLARAATGAGGALEPPPRPPTAEAGIALPTEEVALPDLPDAAALLDPKPAAAEATAKDAGPDKPFTIAVIRQETHLPPVLRLSPLQQVAEPIRQATSELSASRAQEVPDIGTAKTGGIAEPTKILHIQLSPVELGSIVVKLRISQNGMEIRLEASRAETAQLLANDREALREIVRASGHALDQVSVETVHVDSAAADPRPGQDAPRDGAREEGAGRDGRGFDPSRQQDRQNDRQNDRQEPQRRDAHNDAPISTEDTHDRRESLRPGRDPLRYL
ncbi:MAG TPA: flagellar hook-length control protein FliK [Bosea sp. (in: a-proteobacteria)]|jgi:flagellar hook-length control protein FliK|uniref:flagellar hook-length control protein FliK n=1 Tax=Bosea sp. (in: a-proteobacteria) TaxID=1871050 RepID=UPI002DDC9404|nr:flagellar hook-length control protein FliK [Bosea sp. (in: a-proteobacteria)]HEV2554411.1 flagellar hook-length control protein FliK [Bosea sp. (in: a-proteobacteria)]